MLGQVGESDLQEIVDLLKSVCEVEIAVVGVQDEAAFHYLVAAGVEPVSHPVDISLCQHAMATTGAFVINDTTADDRTRDNPFVDGRLAALRFYASAPVYAPDGTMVGRLCVYDTRARELSPVQEQALLTLGDSVSRILRLRLDRLDEADALPLRRDLEMAARVSHDLRMPLTALNASLELLGEATEDSRGPHRRAAHHQRAPVGGPDVGPGRRADATARAHQRAAPLRGRPGDDRQTGLRRPPPPARGGRTQRCGSASLPTVSADPDLMYSVLLNLVSNAVKFGRTGVPPLVRLHAARREGGWRVGVTDNGTGVPSHQREAVFGMFTRLTDAPGHGIGLTTVAQIIRAHGGAVGIADSDGPGCEFWFELPDA